MYPWDDKDLCDLDAKFDALAEYLGVEFVFERVSDGSDIADREKCYVRPKQATEEEIDIALAGIEVEPTNKPEPVPENLAVEEDPHGVEPPTCSRILPRGTKCEREVYREGRCLRHFKSKSY